MNEKDRSQYAREYVKLSMMPNIKLEISETLAVAIIIQMQKAFRVSESTDREVMEYLMNFCKDLLDGVSASREFKEILNQGWNFPIDFNNSFTPPDELN